MIVTIDGPAGAGKSSVAREVATVLGFDFLDTGALYRAVTLAAIRANVDWQQPNQLIALANQIDIEVRDQSIFLANENVTKLIRTPSVTDVIRYVADIPEIRELLTRKQQSLAMGRDLVTEGRDQGTEVFPHAECKIFLTASPEERARRRQQQLILAGRPLPLEDILTKQNQRDLEDRMRPMGRLRPAADAIIVQTDGMTSEAVMSHVLGIIHARRESLMLCERTG